MGRPNSVKGVAEELPWLIGDISEFPRRWGFRAVGGCRPPLTLRSSGEGDGEATAWLNLEGLPPLGGLLTTGGAKTGLINLRGLGDKTSAVDVLISEGGLGAGALRGLAAGFCMSFGEGSASVCPGFGPAASRGGLVPVLGFGDMDSCSGSFGFGIGMAEILSELRSGGVGNLGAATSTWPASAPWRNGLDAAFLFDMPRFPPNV